ncbi:TIGR04211 family SH3 domain-containing protein [Sesbania bispinosa]|nr:TIGR04211 family SH3 domain-containing protein [Sesbania bispinosa]
MAGNNMLVLAEKRAKREAAKKAAADAEAAIGTVVGTSTPQSPQPDATKTSTGVPPSPRISWATPDPEEDEAMKLLGQQGQRVSRGSSAAEMKDFLGQIKKDFEAVSKKLKEDEVKMQDALKKVKGLSDDNIKLTDRNKELEEEVEKLKSALATKKSEATQAGLTELEMVDAKILGLDDSKPSEGETEMPSANAAKE